MKALFLLAAIGCGPVFAQTGPTVQCTAANGNAPTLRGEGSNEQVVTVLTCTGGTPTAAGQPVPLMDITVSFNVPVSNPTVIANSAWVNSYLFIDNPAPSNQNVASIAASSGLSYSGSTVQGVGGAGLDYKSGAVPNVFYGRKNGFNSVTFKGVPFDPSPNGRSITIDPELHYEVFAHGSGTTIKSRPDVLETILLALTEGEILSKLSNVSEFHELEKPAATTSGPVAVTVTPSQLDLGAMTDCFVYQTIAGSAPANKAFNTGLLGPSPALPPSPSANLHFSTLFPGCLRTRSTGFQDVIGQAYNTDAGFTSPALPAVFANFGTELQAVFKNIPAGVSVFVQTSVTNAAGTIQLTSSGTAAGSTGLTQIPVSNGSATAVWETQSADPTQTGTFAVPVYFAFQPGVAAPSNITVIQSLASPPGGVSFAQPPAAQLQPDLFSINTGASTTPVLSAVLDSRPCILGVGFLSNNACTGNVGLPVNVVTDSASVTINSPTFTASGGLTNFALTPYQTTPSDSQIFPNASNANPGVYKESLTVSATGAANSLSIPFTVTVLPTNNPVFELNEIDDAFSYQSQTIAPGQIFTIFGSNFGPSALVSGTLDTSGKLSTNVANTQVLFDNVASPLLYVANGQLSGVAPFELTGKSSTNVQIVSNGLTSPTVTVPVQASSISIASADGSGGNGGVIINKDGTLNTISNPASDGDTVVIYASYAGPFANGVTGTDGRTTTAPPYPAPAGPVSVTFGGVPATNIPYFGNAPGYLESVMQINVTIPAGVKPDLYIPVIISAGGATSAPWTTIAVH